MERKKSCKICVFCRPVCIPTNHCIIDPNPPVSQPDAPHNISTQFDSGENGFLFHSRFNSPSNSAQNISASSKSVNQNIYLKPSRTVQGSPISSDSRFAI